MFDLQPHLTGSLIALRPVRAEDRDALYVVARDPDIWALHPNPDRWQEPVFQAYFDDGLASGGALIATDLATGAIIGWSRYSAAFVQPGEIEIGWTFLGRAWWGGAYNSDMKQMMLVHAFKFVDQAVFRIGKDNLRSRRAAEKIGARLDPRVMGGNVFYVLPRAVFDAGQSD